MALLGEIDKVIKNLEIGALKELIDTAQTEMDKRQTLLVQELLIGIYDALPKLHVTGADTECSYQLDRYRKPTGLSVRVSLNPSWDGDFTVISNALLHTVNFLVQNNCGHWLTYANLLSPEATLVINISLPGLQIVVPGLEVHKGEDEPEKVQIDTILVAMKHLAEVDKNG